MQIRIPRTTTSRRERTYAQIVEKVYPHRPYLPFAGPMFRCGALIDEQRLAPDRAALLIEFAGSDYSGRGHNRSNDIHVLWRYDRAKGSWIELARTLSQGREWTYRLMPIIEREFKAPAINYAEVADRVSARVLGVLDEELDELPDEGRERVMSFLYDQFAARLVAAAA